MEIIIPKGCDNAPRKEILIDFTKAMLKNQDGVLQKYISEDLNWHQLKQKRIISGIDDFLSAFDAHSSSVDCLEIDQVITHGKFASVNGIIKFSNQTTQHFCDVYTFSSAAKSGKIKVIKTYTI